MDALIKAMAQEVEAVQMDFTLTWPVEEVTTEAAEALPEGVPERWRLGMNPFGYAIFAAFGLVASFLSFGGDGIIDAIGVDGDAHALTRKLAVGASAFTAALGLLLGAFGRQWVWTARRQWGVLFRRQPVITIREAPARGAALLSGASTPPTLRWSVELPPEGLDDPGRVAPVARAGAVALSPEAVALDLTRRPEGGAVLLIRPTTGGPGFALNLDLALWSSPTSPADLLALDRGGVDLHLDDQRTLIEVLQHILEVQGVALPRGWPRQDGAQDPVDWG